MFALLCPNWWKATGLVETLIVASRTRFFCEATQTLQVGGLKLEFLLRLREHRNVPPVTSVTPSEQTIVTESSVLVQNCQLLVRGFLVVVIFLSSTRKKTQHIVVVMQLCC